MSNSMTAPPISDPVAAVKPMKAMRTRELLKTPTANVHERPNSDSKADRIDDADSTKVSLSKNRQIERTSSSQGDSNTGFEAVFADIVHPTAQPAGEKVQNQPMPPVPPASFYSAPSMLRASDDLNKDTPLSSESVSDRAPMTGRSNCALTLP